MTILRRLLPLLLLGLAACSAPLPFAATPRVPLPARSAAEVAALDWCRGDGVLLLRQSVLFELGGGRFPVSGLLRLDRGAGTARLVGMDDFGVKLFDLEVNASGHSVHSLLPDLARRPGLAAAVAASVRRIWLAPRPDPADTLDADSDSYRLQRRDVAGTTRFVFGGAPPALLETEFLPAEGEGWRVRYFEYQAADGLSWPRGIILDDRDAGYRLTVRIESVRRAS